MLSAPHRGIARCVYGRSDASNLLFLRTKCGTSRATSPTGTDNEWISCVGRANTHYRFGEPRSKYQCGRIPENEISHVIHNSFSSLRSRAFGRASTKRNIRHFSHQMLACVGQVSFSSVSIGFPDKRKVKNESQNKEEIKKGKNSTRELLPLSARLNEFSNQVHSVFVHIRTHIHAHAHARHGNERKH